jgi:quercetin dioxygenase-like cupin family protein
MKRLTLVLFIALLHVAGSSSAQQQVESKGTTPQIKLESVISGYLTELNGKYKFRVTQITYEPGGYTGEHHHVGPGIRYVASGELTLVEQDKARTYKTGDYYFESGDVTHTATNNTSSPTVLINIEILPADWKGGTAVPPKSK